MRYLTVLLAVAFTACVCATAIARPIGTPATTARPSSGTGVSHQDLRNPDNRVATHGSVPAQDLRNPDNRVAPGTGSTQAVQSAASATRSKPSVAPAISAGSGGLSAFVIVLICVGGAVALTGVAYSAMRAVHRHGHALS